MTRHEPRRGGSLHDRGVGHVVVQVVVEVEDGREGDGINKRARDQIPHEVAHVDMRRWSDKARG